MVCYTAAVLRRGSYFDLATHALSSNYALSEFANRSDHVVTRRRSNQIVICLNLHVQTVALINCDVLPDGPPLRRGRSSENATCSDPATAPLPRFESWTIARIDASAVWKMKFVPSNSSLPDLSSASILEIKCGRNP